MIEALNPMVAIIGDVDIKSVDDSNIVRLIERC